MTRSTPRLTAALLLGAGTWLLVAGTVAARMVSAVALGALLHTTVNSPGYYADRGEPAAVAMFVALPLSTAAATLTLLLDTA